MSFVFVSVFISKKLVFERLAHLWRVHGAHDQTRMIPALVSFARILTMYLFCTSWATGPSEWGGGSVCAPPSVSAPAQGGSSLNICLMSEKKNKWRHPTLGRGGRLAAPLTQTSNI